MADVIVNFEPKGDDEVLDAIKKVTRQINDLKRVAKVDLNIAQKVMPTDDFNRLKSVVDKAKEATRDYAKEAAAAAREQTRLAAAAERAAQRAQAAAEKAAAREQAASERAAAKAERDAQRKAAAAERAAARAAAAFEKAAAREARANPVMGGITGSMFGGRGGGGGGGGLPLGGASSMGPDPRMFSTKAVDAMKRSLGELGDKAKHAGFQLGFVTRIIAAMGIRAAVREVFQLADAYTTLQNKLKVTVGAESVGFISKELFQIAQDSRMSLESVTTAFSRTTRSVKALGKSQQEVLQFTDSLSKAIAIGGSTSVEASNAMIQLSQGMGSGALRGDELRSVLEQLPIVAELIADKMGVPIAALRKLGSEGKITTDVIFDAISGKSEELTEKMKTMQLTVGQAWTQLKNQATMSSAALQGVMQGLANTIQFVTNNLDGLVTAVLMLASGSAMGMLIKGVIAAKDAFLALRVAMAAHPILTAAAVIATVTAALVPFVAQLRIAESSTVTFGDVWGSTWDQIKEDLIGDEMVDGIKTVDGAMTELAASTEAWFLSSAAGLDAFTSMVPVLAQIKGLVAWMTDTDAPTMFYDKTKQIIDRTNRDAHARETDRMLEEAKNLLAEDMSMDGGLSEEDRLAQEFEKERKGLLEYAKILAEKEAKKKKGKDPSGKTFAELMEDLNKSRDKAGIVNDLSDSSIEARVANEWLDAVDKLEDAIANGLTPAQSKLIEKTIEEKVILEDMLKLREQIQKSMKDEEKAQVEDFVKRYEAWFKFKEEQEKIAGKEARADREVDRFSSMQQIAGSISPNFVIQQQVLELEKFHEFAKDNKLEDWAKRSKEAIEELKTSMRWENTHFETFADQMNSIFGPGGSLVKGFADAAANAIVMSNSLGDLRRALVDVLNSVQKQALSALIELPMNLAMGALTNSITGGAGPTALGSSGVRQVGAAEAAGWNLGGSLGFASGGYTGNMGTSQVAGVVHGQEFVLNAEATRRMGRQNLEMINKGATPVSGGAAPVININNNAAGVQVEANQVSPGQIEVMISKAIRDQTGRVVAGQINDPNSMVSRSLQKNISSDRRRV